MSKPYMNVVEPYPLYDTVIVSKSLYGKEQGLVGWYTTFSDFAADGKHTFFKSRTAGSSHLAYCNMDSADQIDFVYKCFSIGVRFFAPVMPDSQLIDDIPANYNENIQTFWMFDLAKHIGFDFRVQQDVIVENTCIAMPPGYGPRGGGGVVSTPTGNPPATNSDPWKVVVGSNGEPVVDNRFDFESPLAIPRNSSIEANLYLSPYARHVLTQSMGPELNTIPAASSAEPPMEYISYPARYGVQVSLFGYREVQQRGQYFAPGALNAG
jgi:hypothetical protein